MRMTPSSPDPPLLLLLLLALCVTLTDDGAPLLRVNPHTHRCRYGYFNVRGMGDVCHPWLRCDDLKINFSVERTIGRGLVKEVYLAKWGEVEVVYSKLASPDYYSDLRDGLDMVRAFQPITHVVQLVGWCDDAILTEYHPMGSLDNLDVILNSVTFQSADSWTRRFQLAIGYVEILNFLHQSPLGTRVMCDSNNIIKTLSQFLLTLDLTLVVNDLDALPQTLHSDTLPHTLPSDPHPLGGVKCGPRQLFGDFVAPEQLWPYDDLEFDSDLMPDYDEKTDVWKLPDVVGFILGGEGGSCPEIEVIKLHLFKIHLRCKNKDPTLRPDTAEILVKYRKVYQFFTDS